MNDQQLLRYSRQIMLPQVDYPGQLRLLNARVLIIGIGGLGSPAAIYLAAAGVGQLVLVDDDQVELSNLQRQIIHTTDQIGEQKVASAARHLQAINPDCQVHTIDSRLSDEALQIEISKADVVVDGSDNFSTRFAINAACVALRTPLVSGAAIRMEGQVTVFSNQGNGPCYRCLYREAEEGDTLCSENGILAPVVGIIGTIQATEVLKLLIGCGVSLEGRLMILDAMVMEWRTLTLRRDPACPICGEH